MNLEQRIYMLEKTPYGADVNIFNPPSGNHCHSSAVDSVMPQESSTMVDRNGEEEDDETDRIYTIDAVHGATVIDENEDEELIRSRLKEESDQKGQFDRGETDEGDIKKLYMRLGALEADRESMRQAIISMRTEKAQIVLLREIAQHLCKEVKPERTIVKKNRSLFGVFSILSLIKVSFFNLLVAWFYI
ncbi:myosin-binding protein 7-like [Phalaenopsis equestris]|uniref:myosin-binding protein 7-like n=1 Tax=Phalaenopsis equestris TaxID=78828 RepID=UPI0009E2E901|nr:myosin-binding protein 7-like [Phalaenopsis equestris]